MHRGQIGKGRGQYNAMKCYVSVLNSCTKSMLKYIYMISATSERSERDIISERITLHDQFWRKKMPLIIIVSFRAHSL